MHLSRSHDFDELLTGAATWLLLACAAWAALILAAALLEAVTNRRVRATRWVPCPPALRRILLAALGVALVGGPGTATASPAMSRPPDGAGRALTARQPLPVPARPLGEDDAGSSVVRVRAGDTLWQLAETRLRARAPATVVANLVTITHRRNQAVIGPDPDLIRPGQHLTIPATTDTGGAP